MSQSDYTAWNFVQDIAALVNCAMRIFKGVEPELYSASMRLDVKLLSLLYSQPKLRDEYKRLRSVKTTQMWTSPKLKKGTSGEQKTSSANKTKESEIPKMTVLNDSLRNDSGFFDHNKTSQNESNILATPKPKKPSDESTKSDGGNSTPTSGSTKNPAALALLTPKVETVEVDEEVDICQKIFLDIRSKHTFQVFQNVSEVSLVLFNEVICKYFGSDFFGDIVCAYLSCLFLFDVAIENWESYSTSFFTVYSADFKYPDKGTKLENEYAFFFKLNWHLKK